MKPKVITTIFFFVIYWQNPTQVSRQELHYHYNCLINCRIRRIIYVDKNQTVVHSGTKLILLHLLKCRLCFVQLFKMDSCSCTSHISLGASIFLHLNIQKFVNIISCVCVCCIMVAITIAILQWPPRAVLSFHGNNEDT